MTPKRYARTCGLLYLYIIAAGTFAEMAVRSALVVRSNAPVTAHNILAREQLFRLGFTAELLHLACDVAVAVLLYALLRPVHRHVAMLAAFMRLACDVVLAVASISHHAALRLAAGAPWLDAFTPDQRYGLALLAMRLHGDAYAIALVFFGFACLALGHLVYRSTFLPRVLGVLLGIAGACYLVNSFAYLLHPPLAAVLFPAVLTPCFVAELGFALWLVSKGVDEARWTAAARRGEPLAPPTPAR